MKKMSFLASSVILLSLTLTGCNALESNPENGKYTIQFVNYDGTVLESYEGVSYGAIPSFNGVTPVRETDAQYTYTFSGWSPTLSTVTKDQTYTAQYLTRTNAYTITWCNSDGSILEVDRGIPYGTTPSYDGWAPTKRTDAQYTYTFSGWSPEVAPVVGDQTYTAHYSTTTNTYTITWKNYDGEVLKVDENVPYGTKPSYTGDAPIKESDDSKYGYLFIGWSPTVSSVKADITYIAQYEKGLSPTLDKLVFKPNDSGGYTVLKASNNIEGDVGIPAIYNDLPVTQIDNRGFFNCSSLTSIYIPSSVTSIGNYAFSYCSSLTSITILNSVTSIGDYAFSECPLVSIAIPNSVTSIKRGTFSVCTLLTSVIIPNSVISIGSDAFQNCSSLTSIAIPNSVTSIGSDAFQFCYSLTSITIPNNITSIGNYAFQFCYYLTSVTIPNSVTSIGRGAFSNCYHLVEIVNKSNLVFKIGSTDYGYIAYYAKQIIEDESLSKLSTDESGFVIYTDNLEASLIMYVGNSTDLTIPNNITSIGDYAFQYCYSLTSIAIPDSVTSIGDYAFSRCPSLASVAIPNSVTSIGNSVFSYCSSLTTITIPDSTTSIGDYAFSQCPSLASVVIPDSVTSIGMGAFSGCSSLTSVTIPNSVTSIGMNAFRDCSSLTSVTIPNSVTSIGSEAFYGCYHLVEIVNKSNLDFKTGSTDYGYIAYYAKQIIEDKSLSKLSTDKNGFVIYTDESEVSLIKYVGNSADLTIPNNITSIGNYAFNINVISIAIPNSITSINVNAFADCLLLESITYEGTIKEWKELTLGMSAYSEEVVVHCKNGDTVIG